MSNAPRRAPPPLRAVDSPPETARPELRAEERLVVVSKEPPSSTAGGTAILFVFGLAALAALAGAAYRLAGL